MAAETLHFESARFAQQLFNNEARNLQAVEEQLGVKATAREGWIKLEGEPAAIDRAKQLFLLLEGSLKRRFAGPQPRVLARARRGVPGRRRPALREIAFRSASRSSSKKPTVTPKTVGQKSKYVEAIRQHDVTFGIGPAGTGKTYLAMAMAVAALKEEKVGRIILTRPAVEAGEALGFASRRPPATKRSPLTSVRCMTRVAGHAARGGNPKYMERNVIEVAPLAYMRGRTLNHAFIILDEAQNATAEQMFMFLTRLGLSSKAVITGDETQMDLPSHKRSGLLEAHRALRNTEGIGIVELTRRDVVRHPLVQRIIAAYEEHRGKAR